MRPSTSVATGVVGLACLWLPAGCGIIGYPLQSAEDDGAPGAGDGSVTGPDAPEAGIGGDAGTMGMGGSGGSPRGELDAGIRCDAGPAPDSGVPACPTDCARDEICVAGSCVAGYVSPPSNLDPMIETGSLPDTVLDCGTSQFDATTLGFANWCDQTPPTPVVQTQPEGPDLVVIPVRSLQLAAGATLRVVGERPVAFAVYGDAHVAGTLDASAAAATPGAGGDWSCNASQGRDGDGSFRSGGGGGGAFGASGGDGGHGNWSASDGGGGGSPRGDVSLVPLLGGCGGGDGGGCTNAAAGGGAIQISATGRLEVTGSVLAHGGQGGAGCDGNGGGGGGSGGSVLLEASELVVAAQALIAANGGDGGDSGGSGGDGGDADGSAQNGGTDWVAGTGGGGGGGSLGRIRFEADVSCLIEGTSSPSASTDCP